MVLEVFSLPVFPVSSSLAPSVFCKQCGQLELSAHVSIYGFARVAVESW